MCFKYLIFQFKVITNFFVKSINIYVCFTSIYPFVVLFRIKLFAFVFLDKLLYLLTSYFTNN